MSSKWIFPAAGMMLLALTACQTKQDVPVPDDPQAQTWSPAIKAAYPDWQPTKDAPVGNADYEALFAAKPQAPAPAVIEAPAPATDACLPAPVIDEVEKAKYPILYAPVPDKVRLDITEKGDCLVNGVVLPMEIVQKYLKAIVKAHGAASVAIVYPQTAKVPAGKVNAVLDLCRQEKIASVSLVMPAAPAPAPAAPAAGKKAPAPVKKSVRMVVDSSKPATEYIVQKDDSLSAIALKQYKNAAHWVFIYNANKNVLKNPNRLSPKMKLQIPALKAAETPEK